MQISILYTELALKNETIKNHIKYYIKTIFKKYYLEDYRINIKAWNEYKANIEALKKMNPRMMKKNSECFMYLNEYFHHCTEIEKKPATHSCGDRLIEVYNNDLQ